MDTRKKPFSEFERDFFIKILNKYSHIVENKKNDGPTIKKKNKAWSCILEEYNASSKTFQKANMKQLKKLWSNMKLRAREIKINDEAIEDESADEDCLFWLDHQNGSMKIERRSENVELTDPFETVAAEYDPEQIMEMPKITQIESGDSVELSTKISSRRRTTSETLDDIRKKMLKQDLRHKEEKHKLEIEHLKNMYKLKEEEAKLKLEILKSQINV